MHLIDDHGRTMDAEYLVETDGSHLALIMESRSGMSGARPPRNPDYNRALAILLARLGRLDAVLVDAVVDSRHTQDLGVPRQTAGLSRRRSGSPWSLTRMPCDAAWVQHRPRSRRHPMRLRVVIPPSASGSALMFLASRLGDAARLAQTLAAPVAETSGKAPGYWWEHEARRERMDGDNPPR